MDWLSTISDIVEIASGLATIAALGVGAVWTYWLFIRKRPSFPRADLSIEIEHAQTDLQPVLFTSQ